MPNDKYIKNYIGGHLSPANSGLFREAVNPATGLPLVKFPESDEEDASAAFSAAEQAWPSWVAMDVERRSRVLLRLADILFQEQESFARAEASNSGRPLSMALAMNLPAAESCLRYYATLPLHLDVRGQQRSGGALSIQMRRPLGTVVCAPRWDYPLWSLCRQVAPALSAGNCVIILPSENTPYTAHHFARACLQAGMPSGVCNVVFGEQGALLEYFADHDGIQGIAIGDLPQRDEYWKTSHKLWHSPSGKNAGIVFEDCTFDEMVFGVLQAAFSNNGQGAFNISRLLVERPVYANLKDELVKRTQFIKVGDPFNALTDLGALISQENLDRMLNSISMAEIEGGSLLCGGNRPELTGLHKEGFFFRPAILEGLGMETQTNNKVHFGPLLTLTPFDGLEEAVHLANAVGPQRATVLWTNKIEKASKAADLLHSGLIWVNDWLEFELHQSYPISGGLGYAYEGGVASLNFFSREKVVQYGI